MSTKYDRSEARLAELGLRNAARRKYFVDEMGARAEAQ